VLVWYGLVFSPLPNIVYLVFSITASTTTQPRITSSPTNLSYKSLLLDGFLKNEKNMFKVSE